MIKTRRQLKAYIQIDQIMNRGGNSLKRRFVQVFYPDYIMQFLRLYRKVEYYSSRNNLVAKICFYLQRMRCDRLMLKLGLSIEYNIFGYGLVIPHYGTIVVGKGNKIGNYCVLHTSTCITTGKKKIGNGFYLSTGSKVINDPTIGDFVSVAPNSLVNKNCDGISASMVAGNPAKFIKESVPWYIRDGYEFQERYRQCEEIAMKTKLTIQ